MADSFDWPAFPATILPSSQQLHLLEAGAMVEGARMTELDELKGRILAGRYQLESRLGQGGMGSIWRAHHLVLAAPVAVKLIEQKMAPDPEMSGRFMREAQAAATLRSPHVVQIIDYGIDGIIPFIVMELLEGETLAQRIKRAGVLTPAETMRIMSHVTRAVGKAHEAHIIHRDLKPENVFLVHNEDEEIAKVLDFGVAKVATGALAKDGTYTRTGAIMGTPYYMSPEQAQGNKAVDHRSDLWSLGVIAFECMTGRRPFFSEGLGDLVLQICIRDLPVPSQFAQVPAGFDAWFAKAVARDPDQRFQSAREMSDALREALGFEARETQTHLTEAYGAGSIRGTPTPKSQTHRGLGGPASQQNGVADGNAATVALVPQELPARSLLSSEELILDHEQPPSGMRVIFGVAAGALIAGVTIGFLFLRHRAFDRDKTERESASEVERRAPNTVRPTQPSANPDNFEFPPVPSAAASAADAAAPSATGDAGVRDAGALVLDAGAARAAGSAEKPKRPKEEPTTPPAAATTDAGWVKPDWAIPDEPPRRPSEGSLPEANE